MKSSVRVQVKSVSKIKMTINNAIIKNTVINKTVIKLSFLERIKH